MLLKTAKEYRFIYDNEKEANEKYLTTEGVKNYFFRREYKDFNLELDRWVFVVEYKIVEYNKLLKS